MNLEEKLKEQEEISMLIRALTECARGDYSPEIKNLLLETLPKLLDYSQKIALEIIINVFNGRSR